MNLLTKSILVTTAPPGLKPVMLIPVPATGEISKLEQLDDPVYQHHLLGEGVAVNMTQGQIFAPVTGAVECVDFARGQMRLLSKNGLRLILQIGLPGAIAHAERIEFNVKSGQKITQHQLLAVCDTLWVKQQGKVPWCILTLFNTAKLKAIEITNKKTVRTGEDNLLTLYV